MNGKDTPTPQASSRRKHFGTWVILGTALLAGACGGGGGQEQAAPRSEPPVIASVPAFPERQRLDDLDICALLTEDEIADALGVAPQSPGQAEVLFPNHQCDWQLPAGETFIAGVLLNEDPATAANIFGDIENEKSLASHRPVGALGDKAIFYAGPGTDGPESDLLVRDGKLIVVVTYSEATADQQLTELVKKMLERIEK